MSEPPADHPEIRAYVKRIRSEPKCVSMIAADHIDTLLRENAEKSRAVAVLIENGKRLQADNERLRKALERAIQLLPEHIRKEVGLQQAFKEGDAAALSPQEAEGAQRG